MRYWVWSESFSPGGHHCLQIIRDDKNQSLSHFAPGSVHVNPKHSHMQRQVQDAELWQLFWGVIVVSRSVAWRRFALSKRELVQPKAFSSPKWQTSCLPPSPTSAARMSVKRSKGGHLMGVGIPASVISGRYRSITLPDMFPLLQYQTGSGIGIFFILISGLTGGRTLRYFKKLY